MLLYKTYIVADIKGSIMMMITAISAYKNPATNVHCKLIFYNGMLKVNTYFKNFRSKIVKIDKITEEKKKNESGYEIKISL